MSIIKKVTIGADPELFFIKNNKAKSVEGLIGGTKEDPIPLDREGFFLQEDNVMAEFNIPPSRNSQEFSENIEYALDNIETIAKVNDCKLAIIPSMKFDKEELNSEQGMLFGCLADTNAYTRYENPRVEIKENIRVAGGHIHIGYENSDTETNIKLIRALDIFLGLPSLVKDKDTKRREYYGSAGSFREKTFGVEYRVLSNFWIKDEESRKWAFNQVKQAINFINSGSMDMVDIKTLAQVKLAIDDNDISLAMSLEEKIINNFVIK
jgi:hypothetical protein